jgi:acyl-coenzyme A thioesterase 13
MAATGEIPTEFEPWAHPSPVLDRLGPFWQHRNDPARVGLLVDEQKVNARGFLHAGVVATFADVAIGHGLAASTQPPARLVTVSLHCDYTGSADLGAWVEGWLRLDRVGRRLATGGATFVCAGRTIATARGLYLPVDSTAG